jgi:CHAT domain
VAKADVLNEIGSLCGAGCVKYNPATPKGRSSYGPLEGRITPSLNMVGNSKAKKALQDAVRILTTVPSQAPNSRVRILEAAQWRARDAASLARSSSDRSGSTLWAEAMLISADCAFRLGKPDEGLAAMLASAATHLEFATGPKNAELANVAYAISRSYSRLGDSKRAALFAAETYLRTPRRDRDIRRLVWCLAAMIAAGDRAPVVELLADLPRQQLAGAARSMFLIVEHASRCQMHPLPKILEANELLATEPAESAVLFRLTVAAELRAVGRPQHAREVLEGLLRQLAVEAAPVWTIARVRQVVADILVGERRYEEALSEALSSWVVLDEFRYCTGSHRLRRTIHNSYALARHAAMTAAAELHDWALLSELIEAARLQSSSDTEGSLDEFDAAMEGRGPADPDRSGARTINVDRVPAPYRYIYSDLTDSRTDLAMAADVTVAGRSRIALVREKLRPEVPHLARSRKSLALESCIENAYDGSALWWSTWHERGSIFWTAVSRSRPTEGGYIDLDVDQALREALTICYDGNRLQAPWRANGQPPRHFDQALRICDSPTELDLTGRLARLIPPPILRTPESGHSSTPTRLIISPAPDLSCVPWPILPIGGPPDAPVRLIERYELQFMPSLTTVYEAISADREQDPGRVPFTMSCDYLVPDALPPLPRTAKVRFGTGRQHADDPAILLATPEAVAAYLRSVRPGEPGLIAFRTHFNSAAGDPTASGFELNGGMLEVGWLLPRDRNAGRTILGMTSRVLLSCCSTSAAQERHGGESLGLVAACLRSGASMIVATSVDIPHTSFTNQFDELLTEMMLGNTSHVRGLHSLQIQMLRKWRGITEEAVKTKEWDISDPLPVIWTYYQAFGKGE